MLERRHQEQWTLGDGELSPACMADTFRCLGKAARAALCAIAQHLCLRTDVFNHLLDDAPLPENEVSSSELLVVYSNKQLQSGQAPIGCLRSSMAETNRSFVMLVASDRPGIEAWHLRTTGRSIELIDPSLRNEARTTEITRCIQIALLCVQTDPADRPSMSDVLPMLNTESIIPAPKLPDLYRGEDTNEATWSLPDLYRAEDTSEATWSSCDLTWPR